MTHISYETSGVQARFNTCDDVEELVIELDDASYAKAEQVLFNPDSSALHAVMHEGVFLIGQVPQECSARLCHDGYVVLGAAHFSGADLRLKSRVVFTQ